MAGHVFVSYRSEDKTAAERICQALEHERIQCWIAPRDIAAGREWATAIVEAIQASGTFVLVLSANSKNAKQISREAELADRQGIPIITFRVEDVQPPPGLMYFLGNIQWLDGFGSQFDSAITQLTRLVRQTADGTKQINPLSTVNAAAELREADFAAPAMAAIGTTTTGAAAAPAREKPAVAVNPVSQAPEPGVQASKGSVPWLAIAGVAVLVILGFVFFHRSPASLPVGPPSDTGSSSSSTGSVPSDSVGAAREVAERFLEERDSGNLEAAWNYYAPGAASKAAWEQEVRTQILAHGQPRAKLDVCNRMESRVVCTFMLTFPNGATSKQMLQLVELNTRWAIASGKFSPVK